MSEDEGKKIPGYRVEYASSGRAKCSLINKGDLRLGTTVTFAGKTSMAWRHWGCVTAKIINNFKSSFSDIGELDGYEELKKADKERLSAAWETGHVADEDVPETAKKGAVDEDDEKDKTKKKPKAKKAKKDEEEEADVPKKKAPKKAPAAKEKAPKKKAVKKKASESEGENFDDEIDKVTDEEDEAEEEEAQNGKKRKRPASKKGAEATKAKKPRAKKTKKKPETDEEEEED